MVAVRSRAAVLAGPVLVPEIIISVCNAVNCQVRGTDGVDLGVRIVVDILAMSNVSERCPMCVDFELRRGTYSSDFSVFGLCCGFGGVFHQHSRGLHAA